MSLHIGTAGFSYKDWEGTVYPADLKKRKIHPLEYLAEFFDCCEINTSFYGHIRPNVGRDWCRKVNAVNPGFLFTAKLYQGFTHWHLVPRSCIFQHAQRAARALSLPASPASSFYPS